MSDARPDLDALLRYWQPLLRLADWEVIVRYERRLGDALAIVSPSLKKKRALIRVMDPVDADPADPWPADIECNLVHELLHLHFAPFQTPNDSPADIAEEQAVETLARAFVELKRRGPE